MSAATTNKNAPAALVVLAFAIVYIVWGSTYFFIGQAVKYIPPMLVGSLRFLLAGGIMLLYCLARKEDVFNWTNIKPAIVSGVLMLVTGNGVLIWSEQYLTSSLSAILLASGPIWFVLLDKRNWQVNFRNGMTITGLLVGMAGVILLFVEKWLKSGVGAAEPAGQGLGSGWQAMVMILLLFGSISWAAGSLYSKYNSTGSSSSVNAGWQMLAAGIVFIPLSLFRGEWSQVHFQEVPVSAWLSILYLVTMGSLAGYSAFVWLLQVRSATQVSTHAYVNPLVAVILGMLFAGDNMTLLQWLGLTVILVSVLLVNMSKYRAALRPGREQSPEGAEKRNITILPTAGKKQTV